MNDMTQHPNSILNPDVVAEWAKEDAKHPERIKDRAQRAVALLPNLITYNAGSVERARKAVELWQSAI